MACNYYSSITFLICFTMMIMIIHIGENETLSKRKRNGLRYIAEAILLGTICEFLGFYLNGDTVLPKVIHGIAKAIEFSVSPVISYLFYVLLNNNDEKKIGGFLLKGIIISNLIIQVFSIFIPLVFFIDNNNYYQRGNYYNIYIASYLIGIFICSIELFKYSKRHQSNGIKTILAIVSLIVCGFGSRFSNPEIHTDWLVTSIVYLTFIIAYSDLYLRMDSLTGLLNRRSYDNRINKIDYDTAIIIFDVDDFKSINDTKGHNYGDRVLKLIAKNILRAYVKYGYCYRIGGDEFCVILREGVLQKLINQDKSKDGYHAIELLGETFNKLLDVEKLKDNELGKVLKGVSKGVDIFKFNDEYDSAEYYQKSIKDSVQKADSRMYNEKSEKKE
ncbi:MAG: GGDEF domain-containing protein [Clostridia bacterium]|nr:GGDEF domain-containing protein [Clostridia bacterium]